MDKHYHEETIIEFGGFPKKLNNMVIESLKKGEAMVMEDGDIFLTRKNSGKEYIYYVAYDDEDEEVWVTREDIITHEVIKVVFWERCPFHIGFVLNGKRVW